MSGELNGYALDLGGTKLAAARFERGQLAEKQQIPTQSNASFEEQSAQMQSILAALGFQKGDVLGVALTGRIDNKGRWSAVNGGTLPHINNVKISDALRRLFGDHITIINDAAAAACGEANFGSGLGVSRFGYITISTGVGGGIVLDGHPLSSPNGLAGHIGFMRSPLGNRQCGSGRFGTVESVAGGRALAAAAHALGHQGFDAKEVFAAHLSQQKWASTIIARAAQAIAIQIADLTSIFELERVALGGSIGLADGFVGLVTNYLAEEPAIFRPKICPAQLGGNSPLYGALDIAESNTT